MATSKEITSINQSEVVMILANDSIMCKNWRLFCLTLKLDQSFMYTLNEMNSRECPIFDIILSIMDHWKSKDPDDANPITLSKILRKVGCFKSADDINTLFGTELIEANIIWFNLREPTRFYSGRDNEMQLIEYQWFECKTSKTMLFVAITGLGGIGKSELARNYAKRFHEVFKGHCIWIDAETEQDLTKSFQNLAKDKLCIQLKDESGEEKSLKVLVGEIYGKLSGKTCLLIFDNLESYNQPIIELFFNLASSQSPTVLKPFVLTTSRYRPAKKLLGRNCTQIQLDILTKEAATKFFSAYLNVRKNSIDDALSNSILRLCERLQFFPLAIQQAAAYIDENLPDDTKRNNFDVEFAIKDYLAKIEIEAKILLDHSLSTCDKLDNATTYLNWVATFDKITGMGEVGVVAIKMMNIISFLSPNDISTEFLFRIFAKVENDYKSFDKNEILKILKDHSLIILSRNKNLISIHRLVQEITRIQLKEKIKLTEFIELILTGIGEMLNHKEIPTNQIVHAQIIWGHVSKIKDVIDKHGRVPDWICERLNDAGKYRESYDFCCQALGDLESTVGQNSRWTLKIKFWKGRAFQELGEYSMALDIVTEVYEKQKELFGVDDENTLHTAEELGAIHLRKEKFKEALIWYEDTLERTERLYGREHQKALGIKNDMALVHSQQGKFKEAMEMHRELLNVQEGLLGKEDPSTLTSKFNLAAVKYKLKEYEDALRMFREVLEVQERVLDVDHPTTVNTKAWIADTYRFFGRMDEAHKLFKEVHEKRVKVLGPTHPITTYSKNNLAIVLQEQGKYKEAMEIHRDDLNLRERVLGKEDLTTLTSKYNLATVKFRLKEYEDALSMFQEVLEVRERVLGLYHPSTLDTKKWKAHTYECLGMLDEAHQLFVDVYEKRLKVLGPTHPQTIIVKNSIALVLRKQGKFKEAMEMHRELLNDKEKVLGKDDPSTLESKNNLATVKYSLKEYEDALRMFQEVLEVQERDLYLDHPSTLYTKVWIADTYKSLGRMGEAHQLFKEVHEKKIKTLGSTHPQTIIVKNRIAQVQESSWKQWMRRAF